MYKVKFLDFDGNTISTHEFATHEQAMKLFTEIGIKRNLQDVCPGAMGAYVVDDEAEEAGMKAQEELKKEIVKRREECEKLYGEADLNKQIDDYSKEISALEEARKAIEEYMGSPFARTGLSPDMMEEYIDVNLWDYDDVANDLYGLCHNYVQDGGGNASFGDAVLQEIDGLIEEDEATLRELENLKIADEDLEDLFENTEAE